jgi:hypothetical protein
MDIKTDWKKIKRHFSNSFGSSLHFSIASVDAGGNPTVTPIGSLILTDAPHGFYFEKYPSKLPKHAKQNRQICVLAVNSNKWFWLKSLWRGKFENTPAIKLYGELGILREAKPEEIARFNRRVRHTNRLKGHKYLWNSMNQVREVKFTRAEKIQLGKMTDF